MGLGDVAVRIGDGGAPIVIWGFAADVMYACSADYSVHGSSTTGLLPEASDLGLGGPLPGGLVKAFAVAEWADTTNSAFAAVGSAVGIPRR